MDIINQIIKEGKKVRLTQTQFSKIISDYYKKNYNISGVFDFLRMNYKYLCECYEYDEELEHDRKLLKEKTVQVLLPCIVAKNSYEYYLARNIVIPGSIELKNLDKEIDKALPNEIIRVLNDEISHIFNELGLSSPLYNLCHDIKTNKVEYTVTITPLNMEDKIKVLEY